MSDGFQNFIGIPPVRILTKRLKLPHVSFRNSFTYDKSFIPGALKTYNLHLVSIYIQ